MTDQRPGCSKSSDLVKHYPVRGGVLRRRKVGTVHAVDGVSFTLGMWAKRWAWSASPAAANRRWRAADPAAGRAVTSGSIRLNGDAISPGLGKAELRAASALDADRVPGPVRLAQSAHDRRAISSANRSASTGSRPAAKSSERVAELFDQVGCGRTR